MGLADVFLQQYSVRKSGDLCEKSFSIPVSLNTPNILPLVKLSAIQAKY
jgi:hypothetical protein